MSEMMRLDEVLSVDDASGGARRLTGSHPWSMVDLWKQYSVPDFEPGVDVSTAPQDTSADGPEDPMDDKRETPVAGPDDIEVDDDPEVASDGAGGWAGGDEGDGMPGEDQVTLDHDEKFRQQKAARHQADVSGRESWKDDEDAEEDDPTDPVPPKRIREVSAPERKTTKAKYRFREGAEFMTVASVLEGDGY